MGADAHADHRGRAGRPARVCADRLFPADAGHPQARARVQKLALEQRKTDLSGIGQMRELIADLYQDGITPRMPRRLRSRSPPSAIWPRRPDPCHRHRQPEPPDRGRGGLGGSGAGGAGQGVRHACSGARQPHRAVQLADPGERHEAPRPAGLSNQRLSVEAFGRLLGGGVAAYRPTVHEDGVPEVDDVIVRRLLDEQRRACSADRGAGRADPE